ncbi:MAG: 1-deoxy-D-xylulose-5-phosphate reductoisomerase [Candidatus Latescibacteria bacterium]|nr:1-deoxy-D-xylulose-5-phosphate reductoisomerase [Candidatus Latescibacterota bacterium]
MKKRILILGSTGSIGTSSLSVIDQFLERFEVIGLAARRNVDLIVEQALMYHPAAVCLVDEKAAEEAAQRLQHDGVTVFSGLHGLVSLVERPDADLVLNALVGGIGLLPTIRAIETGKDVAMANKEPLVMAGRLLVQEAMEHRVQLLPLDSEPSALWQCLKGNGKDIEIQRILLTASGGPFRRRSANDLVRVTLKETLCHPTWKMGRKITVDSATLMNKGLEVIEAHYLFQVPLSRIGVVIHPQSIVHSCVEFVDGSMIAQLSCPDMRLPIQYALTYPDRLPGVVKGLDLMQIGQLTFESPDWETFPCLGLCYEAAEIGGTAPVVLNAANEIAVESFLAGEIPFVDIPGINRELLTRHRVVEHPDLHQILEADTWARQEAMGRVKKVKKKQCS